MDEAQYALPKDMYSCTFFDTEEEAEAYRVESGSHTNYHFSEKANKFYISEPNLLTEAILDSIDKAIDFLNVKVYLGMEYDIGRNWSLNWPHIFLDMLIGMFSYLREVVNFNS